MTNLENLKDACNKLYNNSSDQKNFILSVIALYKKNSDWKEEFEDVHSIEWFVNGIVNLCVGLDFNTGYVTEYDITNMSEEFITKFNDTYLDVVLTLMLSKDPENIYLLKRVLWCGLPGLYENNRKQLSENNSKIEAVWENIKEDTEFIKILKEWYLNVFNKVL